MKRSYQVLEALLLSTGCARQNVPRAWHNAVDTAYLSSDLAKHTAFRAESLPAAAKRVPGKKGCQVLIEPMKKTSFCIDDDF